MLDSSLLRTYVNVRTPNADGKPMQLLQPHNVALLWWPLSQAVPVCPAAGHLPLSGVS